MTKIQRDDFIEMDLTETRYVNLDWIKLAIFWAVTQCSDVVGY
jgi:hypothetical protein